MSGKRERFFKVTGPRVDGPKLHGPRIEGWKLKGPRIEGPHFHRPRVSLTGRGRRVRAGAIVVGVASLVLVGELSGGGGSGSGGNPNTTPGTSSSASGNPVPETFQVGQPHALQHVNEELQGSNGIAFTRVYEGGRATNTWQAGFEPGWPLFPNGKWVKDPVLAGAKCKIEGAGTTLENPRMICDFTGNKGPAKDKYRHHGTAKK